MVEPLLPSRVRRGRDALVRQAAAADDVPKVLEVASRRLRDLVDHDASAWLMTDPATGLPAAPTRVQGITATAEQCSDHWRHEFVARDANLFRHLSRAATPAAALRKTVPDPTRSARYRRFLRPHHFTDELRAVLRTGSTSWATVTLWRREGAEPFSSADLEVLAGLSAPLAHVLRDRTRAQATEPVDGQERPGLLLFDANGHLSSADEQAANWLELLPAEDTVSTRLGLRIPMFLLMTVVRARECVEGAASVRVRSRTGQWIVCHASTTRDSNGSPADTAVVIEPASPSRVAPILVEAYGLTGREQEITRLVARGLGTEDIARELHLSPYTVKDHVKAILGKVGVATRGELVATLYAEHYEPIHMRG